MSTDLLAPIGNSQLVQLAGDAIDTLVSNSAESEVLKSVPVLGTCVALYKETKNIHTYLLTKIDILMYININIIYYEKVIDNLDSLYGSYFVH